MDLSGLKIKPAEGCLILKFVDDDDDDDDAPSSGALPEPVDYEGCLATVVTAGAKTTSKPGQTVITSMWARNGMKLGDGLVLANQYDVVGTITE
jgi:hypothetical protein